MFACKQCGKTYQTQSSLSRHFRNHSIDHSPHRCPTCGVTFSRRDLLVRHVTIHGDADSSQKKKKTRRRCHTACQSCRTARVKCDGEQPCRTCAVNGRRCRFTPRSHRVSHVAAVAASESSNVVSPSPDGSDDDEQPPDPQDHPTPAESVPGNADDPPQPVAPTQSPGPDPLDIINGGPEGLAVLSGVAALDDPGFSWATDHHTGSISWPWLHESLYLQGDSWNEWLGTPNGSFGTVSVDDMLNPYSPSADRVIGAHRQDTSKLPLPGTSRRRESTPRRPLAGQQQQDGMQPPETSRRTRTAAQERVVGELVTYATKPVMESSNSRLCYWHSMSLQVADAFEIGDWISANTEPVLDRMLELYKKHFSPLWPLFSGQGFSPADIHPLLFLTLVSIGAMYGSLQEGCLGTSLHEAIRTALVTPLSSLEETEENLMPLAQARLLVQVAALYFGQRRAFSYAQHLGAVLLAQARCMDIFTAHSTHFSIVSQQREEHDKEWRHLEARKRLAFGILRADAFTSVLMNSRPLLSAEEINLTLPIPDRIWCATDPAPYTRDGFHTGETDTDPGRCLPFCDLVRIALDRSEALLEMDPIGYELLLFGLQGPVWRFSHDPHLFRRLTGAHEGSIMATSLEIHPRRRSSTSSLQIDQLGPIHRQMNDLRDNRLQLIEALKKWEKSFAAVRTIGRCLNDRTSTMSSLLLFYLSYLRLSAPVAELHTVAYSISTQGPLETRQLYTLTLWARSQDGSMAADFACQIFSLLLGETQRPVESRAKHNLLAFSGLHHAAVVLWALAGCHNEDCSSISLPSATDEEPISLCRQQSSRVMLNIVDLYNSLNPARWCSFASAAERLSHFPFPVWESTSTGTFAYTDECRNL